ncbi:MAG: hypothetical protein ACK4YU_01890 [Paracoccus sp. (in: a-proteobacteria)]
MQHLSFCFIIIERDSFIASDLREGLAEACPRCGCQTFRDLSELIAAEPVLKNLDQLPVLITKASLGELRDCGVDQMARRNGWPVAIRMGLDPLSDVDAQGWLSLAAPFTREDVAYLVSQLYRRYPQFELRSA